VRAVFKSSTKLKGSHKLILRPELEHNYSKWAKSSGVKNRIKDKFLPLGQVRVEEVEQGILYSSNYSGMVIVIRGQIYKMRENVTIVDLANDLWGSELTEVLISTANKAIKDISQATNFQQSLPFNKPVRVFA